MPAMNFLHMHSGQIGQMNWVDEARDQGDGTVVILLGGQMASVDTNGTVRFKDYNSPAQGEKATIEGGIITYKPWLENGAANPLFCFEYRSTTPSATKTP